MTRCGKCGALECFCNMAWIGTAMATVMILAILIGAVSVALGVVIR